MKKTHIANALMRNNNSKIWFKTIPIIGGQIKRFMQQLFTQFLLCILYAKGTYNDKAIYFHQDPRPREAQLIW